VKNRIVLKKTNRRRTRFLKIRGFITQKGTMRALTSEQLRVSNFRAVFRGRGGRIYRSEILPGGRYDVRLPAGTYRRTVTMQGYHQSHQTIRVKRNSSERNARNKITLTANAGPNPLPKPTIPLVEIKGFIKSAKDGLLIPSVSDLNFKAIYQATDGKVYTANLLPEGKYSVNLPLGDYTRIVTLVGYTDNSQKVSVVGPSDETDGNNRIIMVPILDFNDWKMVLTWGKIPRDLDSHLLTPWGAKVYYGNKTVQNASLDLDNTTGEGPETIIIKDITSGIFKYYVNNFSREANLVTSNAHVQLTKAGTQKGDFTVPTSPVLDTNHAWHVFDVDISTGIVTTINELVTEVPDN
jgi:hypothetical protein